MANYYACKFGVNRLRIDGDIRQKAAVAAILENVVIAIYRLRPIQQGQFVQHFAHAPVIFHKSPNVNLNNIASYQENEQVQQADLFKRQMLLFHFSTYRSNSFKHYPVYQQVSEWMVRKRC